LRRENGDCVVGINKGTKTEIRVNSFVDITYLTNK
jgi:hypothetical protein